VFKRYLLAIKYLIRDVTILASIQNGVSKPKIFSAVCRTGKCIGSIKKSVPISHSKRSRVMLKALAHLFVY